MARIHTTGVRPQVEQLEARQLLTGNITFNPLSGVVNVQGSPSHDRFTVTSTPDGGIRLRLRGGASDTAVFRRAQVKKIAYQGNRGRDQVVNFTAVPLQRLPPASLTQPGLPPPPTTGPTASGAPFGDHFIDPFGDGKSMESWSAPGQPARVSIFFDPKTLSADEVARLQEAVATLNGLHTGLTLVPTSSPTAQIVVVGKPASPDGLTLAETAATTGPRVGTFSNGKKDYQLTHVEIDVFQNMPWWFGPGAPPAGTYTFDFRSTMEHELGHAAGLDHDTASYPVNDGFDVLYPVAAPGVARWTYSANDVRELTYLY
jgi:hypothetical protein